jgi:hypothetical protein
VRGGRQWLAIFGKAQEVLGLPVRLAIGGFPFAMTTLDIANPAVPKLHALPVEKGAKGHEDEAHQSEQHLKWHRRLSGDGLRHFAMQKTAADRGGQQRDTGNPPGHIAPGHDGISRLACPGSEPVAPRADPKGRRPAMRTGFPDASHSTVFAPMDRSLSVRL